MSDSTQNTGEEQYDPFQLLRDADFSLGEDGEIRVATPEQAPPEPEPEASVEPEVVAQPQHDYEKRYNDLLPEFTRRSQRLAEIEKDVLPRMQRELDELRRQQTKPPDEDAVELSERTFMDPNQAAEAVAKIAQKVIEDRLSAFVERVAPMLEDWEIEQEIREAALAPGREDFFDLLPDIKRVIARSEKEITFGDAYEIAKAFQKIAPETPASVKKEVAPAPSQPRVSAQEIAKQAARLRPEPGVAGEVQEPVKPASSVEEAFNQALEDLYA